MKHRTQALIAMASASLLLVAAAGCGGDGAGKKAGAKEVIIAYATDVDTLDPHQLRSEAAYGVVGNIYGTLMQEEYSAPADGVLKYTGKSTLYLAQSATWNKDRTTLTFKLRPDAVFADGRPITSEDVVYSLRRALSDVGYASAIGTWLNISDPEKGIVAVDTSTVDVKVTHYSPLIEKFLAFQLFPMLDRSAAEKAAGSDDPWAAGFFGKDATESGPYVIDSQVKGQSLTLVKNKAFKASDTADAPDRVVVQNMPDPQQAFLALQNGAVDIVTGLTPDLAQAVERDPDLKLYELAYSDVAFLGMNNKDPVLKDARVRRAISHLIPYQTLRDEVMKGYSGAAYGAVPYPMSDALDPTGEKIAYPTDVNAAKKLLDEAGIKPGELSLTLSVQASDTVLRQSAIFIQSALAQAGIALKVNEMNDADFSTNLGKLQMFLDSWYSWGQDSIYQLFFLLKSGVFTNYTGFSDKKLDKLIEQAMATTDPGERRALSRQAQRIVVDQAPWAFLFTRNVLIGAKSTVSGITHSDDANLRYDRLRIAQ
ncbi:ABC transporter substrate-binding protein [Rhizohabitans arisaemae]|uniref:ABC transporter substrate-binding protein n=1 Tax=Rhizohabitans arisaemae TaxID=2720610 RepID=UPI0024B18F92|nr:ABC transporter substrate-binding protein [Rhizohabitans arisaemae]